MVTSRQIGLARSVSATHTFFCIHICYSTLFQPNRPNRPNRRMIIEPLDSFESSPLSSILYQVWHQGLVPISLTTLVAVLIPPPGRASVATIPNVTAIVARWRLSASIAPIVIARTIIITRTVVVARTVITTRAVIITGAVVVSRAVTITRTIIMARAVVRVTGRTSVVEATGSSVILRREIGFPLITAHAHRSHFQSDWLAVDIDPSKAADGFLCFCNSRECYHTDNELEILSTK